MPYRLPPAWSDARERLVGAKRPVRSWARASAALLSINPLMIVAVSRLRVGVIAKGIRSFWPNGSRSIGVHEIKFFEFSS